MAICVYGTVFNNVNTIEDSVKSVWRPNYNIVIVDNYSTDGTWEKLQELKKEYNLTLLRLKSSRGKGRAYALEHCPENSITIYFDLDVEYNENFHKVLDYVSSDKIYAGFSSAPYFLVSKKDRIIGYGNWYDLNHDEDVELISRMGFDIYIPAIVSRNLRHDSTIDRELHYGKLRMVKVAIDSIRGRGIYFHDLLKIYKDYSLYFKLGMIGLYPIARIKGIYRYNSSLNNALYILLNAANKVVDLKEIGISYDYFVMSVPNWSVYYKSFLSEFEEKVRSKFPGIKKFKCTDGSTKYVLNEEAVFNASISIDLKMKCEEVNTD